MRFTRNLRWPATKAVLCGCHVSHFSFHLFERNAMSENKRQQRVVERILEDEGLRGDLEDTAATALVNWATAHAEAAAADPARPDDVVEAEVQAVRMAARSAARSAESDPKRLIALAEAALKQNDSATN